MKIEREYLFFYVILGFAFAFGVGTWWLIKLSVDSRFSDEILWRGTRRLVAFIVLPFVIMMMGWFVKEISGVKKNENRIQTYTPSYGKSCFKLKGEN